MQRKSILYIEDDKDTCELFSVVLSEYEYAYSQTFSEGSTLIETDNFDLYILDNWLPDGSGIDLCKKIRAFNPDAPIIIVSGVGYKKDVREGLNAGADRYLTKPCDPDELLRIVKELI